MGRKRDGLDSTANLMRGTVELLILRALTWGPKHGYAVSEWIASVTTGDVLVEEGTLYPALHRLEGKDLVSSEWGLSDNRRRAKYYRLTTRGRERLEQDTETWHRYSAAVAKALNWVASQ